MPGKAVWPEATRQRMVRAVLREGYSVPGALRAAKDGALAGFDSSAGVPPENTFRDWVKIAKRNELENRCRDRSVPVEDLLEDLARECLAIAAAELERARNGPKERGRDLKRLTAAIESLRKSGELIAQHRRQPAPSSSLAEQVTRLARRQEPDGAGLARLDPPETPLGAAESPVGALLARAEAEALARRNGG